MNDTSVADTILGEDKVVKVLKLSSIYTRILHLSLFSSNLSYWLLFKIQKSDFIVAVSSR